MITVDKITRNNTSSRGRILQAKPTEIKEPDSSFQPTIHKDYVAIYSQNMQKDLKMLRDFRVKLMNKFD
jgi:hypothetical protein